MIRFFGWLVALALGLLLVAIVFVTARVLLYHQADDAAHLAAKRAYLAEVAGSRHGAAGARPASPPNLVVILFDDLGYGDLGVTGARAIATPHIDQLAEEGLLLTNYYAPATNCTPSRAGLLTGRYAPRTGLTAIVFPDDSPLTWVAKATGTNIRLPAEEITIADVLRAAGYRTFMAGKWHLGNQAPSRPLDFGFENWLGVLYSNDMTPLALWRDEEIVEPAPVDQRFLTERYTDAAVAFIEEQGDEPFFLYMAHSFPHIPLFTSPTQEGQSDAGLYGDVVEDLDHSTGRILAALEKRGLAENTIVLLTSDNGPWYQGAPGRGIRGRKNASWRGSQRVPAIVRWPAGVAAGSRSAEMVMGIDLLPTMLEAAGLPAPPDRDLDGESLLGVLAGGESPHDALFFYMAGDLFAVEQGRWRYRLRRGVSGGEMADSPVRLAMPKGPWLFDLANDPEESWDVSSRFPTIAAKLQGLVDAQLEAAVANPRGWRDPARSREVPGR